MFSAKTIIKLSIISFFITFSAQATCIIQSCTDSDNGNQPTIQGSVTHIIQCSAPEGSVNTSTETFQDSCTNGVSTEYVCQMNVNINTLVATPITTNCKCNRNKKSCLIQLNGIRQ